MQPIHWDWRKFLIAQPHKRIIFPDYAPGKVTAIDESYDLED